MVMDVRKGLVGTEEHDKGALSQLQQWPQPLSMPVWPLDILHKTRFLSTFRVFSAEHFMTHNKFGVLVLQPVYVL